MIAVNEHNMSFAKVQVSQETLPTPSPGLTDLRAQLVSIQQGLPKGSFLLVISSDSEETRTQAAWEALAAILEDTGAVSERNGYIISPPLDQKRNIDDFQHSLTPVVPQTADHWKLDESIILTEPDFIVDCDVGWEAYTFAQQGITHIITLPSYSVVGALSKIGFVDKKREQGLNYNGLPDDVIYPVPVILYYPDFNEIHHWGVIDAGK